MNSDYNFMKAGRSTLIEPPKLSDSELESIDVLLSLFISNAMINSSTYVNYCGRNGVSTTDLVYGLRYEVFEFFSRPNLNNDIVQMTEDYRDMLDNESNDEKGEDDIDDLAISYEKMFRRIIKASILKKWFPEKGFVQMMQYQSPKMETRTDA